MFENKVTKNTGDYYSRYIASWVEAHGQREIFDGPFRTWLEFVGLTEEEANECYNLATNGRLEYESHAKVFLRNYKEVMED